MSASTISFYTTSSSALGARLDSSPQTFSRSPNMRRLHGGGVYLPASGVNRPAGASFGTWFAPPPSSVGSYGVTPGERAIMQEADQQYAQRMQGAEMIASKSFSDQCSLGVETNNKPAVPPSDVHRRTQPAAASHLYPLEDGLGRRPPGLAAFFSELRGAGQRRQPSPRAVLEAARRGWHLARGRFGTQRGAADDQPRRANASSASPEKLVRPRAYVSHSGGLLPQGCVRRVRAERLLYHLL